jgi:hypothetical protein
MHGTDVKEAQRLLAHNVFKQDYQPGPADGEFGEQTMRAAKRAHFWVGDLEAQPVFGSRLHDILSGKQKLTTAAAKRRALRLKEAEQIPLRIKALNLLVTKLGVKEVPAGSNRCWASEWYGMVGPWCAMSVSWAYWTAGSKCFGAGTSYAYVPFIVGAARAGRGGLSITHDPKPGDIVCYDWTGDGIADHVGLFERRQGVSLVCIEGNTAVGNDSNGGEVMRRERNPVHVQAFVHVAR